MTSPCMPGGKTSLPYNPLDLGGACTAPSKHPGTLAFYAPVEEAAREICSVTYKNSTAKHS